MKGPYKIILHFGASGQTCTTHSVLPITDALRAQEMYFRDSSTPGEYSTPSCYAGRSHSVHAERFGTSCCGDAACAANGFDVTLEVHLICDSHVVLFHPLTGAVGRVRNR